MPALVKLPDVFDSASRGEIEGTWLYLPEDQGWGLETTGKLIAHGKDHDENDEAFKAQTKGLMCTLDGATIEQIVGWADDLSGSESAEARLDVFLYYYDFDAFPETLGAPDPPPTEVIMAQLDREFYDSLGAERKGTKCQHATCERGAVALSVFCRSHQFENVNGKPSPFND